MYLKVTKLIKWFIQVVEDMSELEITDDSFIQEKVVLRKIQK